MSPYLLGASLVLVAITLVVVLAIAWRQRRLELAIVPRGTNEDPAVTTDRIIKLVESVATVIRALEERTRELEASVKALGAERSSQDQAVAAVAASVEQVRTDQIAHGQLAAEIAERLLSLDRAVASTVEELGKYQQTLIEDFLPQVSRRDERLVAIDANLTATAERLAKLAESADHNTRETAVLAECFQSLESAVSELTNGLVEVRKPQQDPRERPTDDAAGLARSEASDKAVGPAESPTSGNEPSSGVPAAPSDRAPTTSPTNS